MADTSIEWADKTWNPLLGCERVSAGCDGCYAITTATIRAGNPHPKVAAAFAGLTERRDGRLDWTGRINLLPDRMDQPLGWKKPQRIFVNSQSDLFHKDVPDEFIAQVFAVMSRAPQHTFQLLTKRHGRMRSLLNSGLFWVMVNAERLRMAVPVLSGGGPVLLPNVWLGVSVEDQKRADLRVPALLDTPAAVRWLSCEPLLGAVDLHNCAGVDAIEKDWVGGPSGGSGAPHPFIDWVVVGGESGPGSRPMHPQWARDLRDQCTAAEVPFFFKQWGNWHPYDKAIALNDNRWTLKLCGVTSEGWPFRRGSKSYRELDGRTWNEYPATAERAVA